MEGSKFDDVRVLLLNRPDLGLCSADALHRGEVAVKSPSVAVGYYGSPKEQKKAFVEVGADGRLVHPVVPDVEQPRAEPGMWFLTGDIAERNPSSGGLYELIDRVSAIVATKGGVVVKPGQLEVAIEHDRNVRQCFVYASNDYASIAVVVVTADDAEEMCVPSLQRREAQDTFENVEAFQLLCNKHLDGVGVVVAVTAGQWSPTNGLLNGELKKNRGSIKKRYLPALTELLDGN